MRSLTVLFAILVVASAPANAEAFDRDAFEQSVRPVLAEHCYGCHGPEKQKAGLRLDHGSFIAEGGDTGAPVVAGDPGASRLFEAVSYGNVDFQMPPKGKLPDAAIAALEKWIAGGAVWPDEPVPQGGAEEEDFNLTARRAEHWAWQPVRAVAPPAVADAAWPRDAIDQFILARLESEGYTPATDADRRTLIRRLYFDLTGLPPAPEAVEAFVADTAPDALEKVVDGLLSSSGYGERWGRHWLDLMRYADTYGHEQDFPIPHAHQYRDYVIRAFNDDVPYAELVTEHLAGDVMSNPRRNPKTNRNESILGTGFLFMHQATHAPVDVGADHADRIDNQIDVISKSFLGMTISCARCHEHKFDAISTEDYYALSGVLRSTRQLEAYLDPDGGSFEEVAALRDLKPRGTRVVKQALYGAVRELEQHPESFAPYLAGTYAVWRSVLQQFGETAREEIRGGAARGAAKVVAKEFGLDAKRLTRWTRAVFGPEVMSTSHPLYGWRTAVFGGVEALQLPTPSPGGGEVYADFDAADAVAGWTAHGPAFTEPPTTANAWFIDRKAPSLTPPGVIHSGLLSYALTGSLRSPDFTIEHDSIHFRAAGRGAQIRVVVEGYTLRAFTPLLFETTVHEVNQGPGFQWFHSIKGLTKHKGRKAYIEFVDEGDGWLAVDEIRFGNGAPVAPTRPGLLPSLFEGGAPATITDLVERYATLGQRALKHWVDERATPAETVFAGVLLDHELVDLGENSHRLERLASDCEEASAAVPLPRRALVAAEGTPQEDRVHLRGNYKTPGDVVPRRLPEALGGVVLDEGDTSGRLALARRLFEEDNPLVARVMVNRIWHYLFGRGIVPTVDNFGVLGVAPSHPELLDHLAVRFRENGWSIKGLIRDIVLSRTYGMRSETADQVAEERDPDNILLHRMNRRRLEGEAIRDAVLAVAGTLDDTMYGKPVPAFISPYAEGNRRPAESGPVDGNRRRSVYLEVRRNYLNPMLLAFDFPAPDTTRGRRTVSNVPAQALMLMNSPFVVDQAAALAATLIGAEASIQARMDALFARAFGRGPTDAERGQLEAFLEAQGAQYDLSPAEARDDARVWADLCHVTFTLKEFIFLG